MQQASEIRWASRWDTYLMMMDDQIHWFSIINSVMIVLFLSGMVAMIMLRTLHRDITKYNQLEANEEAQEETGWKLVCAAAPAAAVTALLLPLLPLICAPPERMVLVVRASCTGRNSALATAQPLPLRWQ